MTQDNNPNPFGNNCNDDIKCEFLQFVKNPTNLIMLLCVMGIVLIFAIK